MSNEAPDPDDAHPRILSRTLYATTAAMFAFFITCVQVGPPAIDADADLRWAVIASSAAIPSSLAGGQFAARSRWWALKGWRRECAILGIVGAASPAIAAVVFTASYLDEGAPWGLAAGTVLALLLGLATPSWHTSPTKSGTSAPPDAND